MDNKNNKSDKPEDKQDLPGSSEPADEVAALRQQVESLTKERDELFQKLQRLSADYANFQKRAPRQVADSIAYEKEAIVKSLLPALDNFDQAIANAQKGMTLDAMHKGVRIVYDHLMDILRTHGLEVIESQGQKFDPSLHQALLQQSDMDKEHGCILQEYQKGYKLSGRVIRPAKVIVNKSDIAAQPDEQPPQAPQDETTDTQ
jgi:molecular chaperone GrpE